MSLKGLDLLKRSLKISYNGGNIRMFIFKFSGLRSASVNDTLQGQKVHELREELAHLRREETLLDHHREYIQGILKSMSENKSFKRYNSLKFSFLLFPFYYLNLFLYSLAYVLHTDIRNISNFTEDTLFAIKAPYGSTLEVPESDPSGQSSSHHEIQLSSKNGPIDVFLIQDYSSNVGGGEVLKTTNSEANSEGQAYLPITEAITTRSSNYLELSRPIDFCSSSQGDDNQGGQYFDYSEILNVFNLSNDHQPQVQP